MFKSLKQKAILLAVPASIVAANLVGASAHAQTASDLIPAASGTQIVAGLVTNSWTTFAAIVAIVAGVVVIIGLIWMGIRKIASALFGHAKM